MSTDIRLDHGRYRNILLLEGAVVVAAAADFILDRADRRRNTAGHRRALVHDFDDGLTINFNRDYPGGVTLNDARVRLRVLERRNGKPGLPKNGVIGELLMVRDLRFMDRTPIGESASLYVCTGQDLLRGGVVWRPVEMGKAIVGTD